MTIPSWLAMRTGCRPILLFAPHGGRRHSPREPGRHKVNDLHTASLTSELAARWDAAALVNDSRDRNEIDLNRIRDVRRHAPWMPALLADVLGSMVDAHGFATLLVVHGWNAVQTVCDVGMGVIERDGRCIVAAGGGCTASEEFITTRVRALEQRARTDGIMVTIGARYPAAHHNNLLQLFTAAHRDDEDPAVRTLSRLATSGAIAAAQLELGIPLRWPGRFRTAFAAALTDIFASEPDTSRPATARVTAAALTRTVVSGAATATESSRPASLEVAVAPATGDTRASDASLEHPTAVALRTRGLQFVAGNLLGFTSIDANGNRSTGGRLLLSPGPDRLALFTGELSDRHGPPWTVPRLRYGDDEHGAWRVHYDGPLLAFPMLTPFLDLEQGLARGELIDGTVELGFTPSASSTSAPRRFGKVAGTIDLGGTHWDIDAAAIAHESAPQTPRRYPFCRLTLPEGNGGLELTSTAGVEASSDAATTVASGILPRLERAFTFELSGGGRDGTSARPERATCTLVVAASGGRLTLDLGGVGRNAGGATLEGRCDRLIPVRRPGRAGAVVHTVFALVRFADRPAGWLELATEHRSEPRGAV